MSKVCDIVCRIKLFNDCGESHQTTRHIVEECPITAFTGRLRHLCTPSGSRPSGMVIKTVGETVRVFQTNTNNNSMTYKKRLHCLAFMARFDLYNKNYGQCSILDSWSANNAYIYMTCSAHLVVYILFLRTVNFFPDMSFAYA